MFKKVREWWYKKCGKVTIKEYYDEIKSYGKRALVKEIICLAQKLNKNEEGVEVTFKKSIRKYSKKKLLRTIIVLQLQGNKKFQRVKKKYNKATDLEVRIGARG